MKDKILNSIGVGLLVLCFIASLTRIAFRSGEGNTVDGGDGVTIRFSHWQLEDGVRECFDKIAAEYMKLHPGVKVEQIVIPESIYPNWYITQLIGGTAPDLIELPPGLSSERLSRFFVPLTALAEATNPYNGGTDLENTPLRETLFDGMEGGYYPNLLEYYGVPISGFSVRMFYNLDLLKAVTGSEEMPRTYDELIAVCKLTQAYAAKQGVTVVPIAGSRYNGPMLMAGLFVSQTQTLVEKLNPPGVFGNDPILQANQYLAGAWSLDSPEVRSGYSLMREVGQYMQSGFMQLTRDDAALLFVQRQALMICTGSWDATSIRGQATFPIGVAPVPFPSPDNPVYGKYTLGALSEAGSNASVAFGLTRGSKHQETAKDFLLFLASRRMNQLWTDQSGWIPSVRGVRVKPEVEPFLPIAKGYLPGFGPDLGMANFSFVELGRLYGNAVHLLTSPLGSVDKFVEQIRGKYSAAIAADLRRQTKTNQDIAQRGDTQFTAVAWRSRTNPEEERLKEQFDAFLQVDSVNKRRFYRSRLAAEMAAQSSP